jgi:nicotinamidase-related amidase
MKFGATPALLVIDAQKGIDEVSHWGGNRNNPDAEANIAKLLKLWRQLKLPVIIVQHCSQSITSPLYPDRPGNEFMDFLKLQPNEKLIQKATTSAFVKTDLLLHIEQNQISSLVITGFVTNNSVESTARSAGDLGIEAAVIADAVACFDKVGIDGKKYPSDMVHQLSLANINNEYASILTTHDILQDLPNLNL